MNQEYVAVLKAATEVTGCRSKALRWMEAQELSPFGGKTAAKLVEEGRVQDVIDYIEHLSHGFLG